MTGQQPDAGLVEAVALRISLELDDADVRGTAPIDLARAVVAEVRAHDAARSLRAVVMDLCRTLGHDPSLTSRIVIDAHRIVVTVAVLNDAGRRYLNPLTGELAEDVHVHAITDRPRTPEARG